MFMRPLPVPPRFPVFGLPDSFGGFRWLLLWQRQLGPWEGEISEVSLGHGYPDEGHWIKVTTVLKTPEQHVGEHASVGAIGLEYTAQNAVIGMVEAGEPFDPTLSTTSRRAAQRASIDSEMARVFEAEGVVVLVGWEPTTVSIDGIVHAAYVRRLESAWALVVDLPDLVIGACGPSAMEFDQWELADMTGRLDEYAAGDSSPSQTAAS
jgi:hypothetical protein